MQPDQIHSDPLPDRCLWELDKARALKVLADEAIDNETKFTRLMSTIDGLVVVTPLYVVGGGK
jgi:hypothetical protein